MKKLGIYIHIPFCVKKCNYCDFLSFIPTYVNEYVEALKNQIINEERIIKNEYIVDSIFFGGGTPSILSIEQLDKILNTLFANYSIDDEAEISIEANPESITYEKLKFYINSGINRLSIGLQSPNNKLLKKLGRMHDFEQFLKGYRYAREVGFDNINIDIMSALPTQTLEKYKNGLEKVLDLQPEHISSYGLIIEENTLFYDMYNEFNGNLINELSDETEYLKMYEITGELLTKKGYNRYEISNFAKSGYECRHNLKYWRRNDYIGYGIGAASCIENIRYKVDDNFNNYIKKEYKLDIEYLDKQDIFNEIIMLGLRLKEGIDVNDIHIKTGYSIDFNRLNKLREANLIKYNNNIISLTDKGLEVSSHIMSELML